MEIKTKTGDILIIDNEDFLLVSSSKYYVGKSNLGLKRVRLNNGKPLAWLILKQKESKLEIDHINGNPFDNRKENLRLCTHAQNMFNRGMFKNNKSGIKGVYWEANRKKWGVTIAAYGKKYSGRFNTVEEAKEFYNKMAIKLHGEFARLSR